MSEQGFNFTTQIIEKLFIGDMAFLLPPATVVSKSHWYRHLVVATECAVRILLKNFLVCFFSLTCVFSFVRNEMTALGEAFATDIAFKILLSYKNGKDKSYD